MNIQFVDCTNMFTLEATVSEETVSKKKERRVFSWSPEAKTRYSTYDISSTPSIFAIPEIVYKIFSSLSEEDVRNFEVVCKGHRYVTFPLWNSFKEQKNLAYNWRVCESLEFKEKANYILSNFFIQYASMLFRKKPLKELSQQMSIVCRLFPVFKTFIDAVASTKESHKNLEKFYDKLKDEPILHAATRIYRFINEKMRSNQGAITYIPEETLQITSQAMSEGATCLSQFAIILCQNYKKKFNTVRARYAPFLLALAKRAQKRGDLSGRKQLAEYSRAHENVHYLNRLRCSLNKQLFFEPTADEILTEDNLFRELRARILNPHLDLYTDRNGFVENPEHLMELLVDHEKYDQANDILDAFLQRGHQPSGQGSYTSIIRIKTHFKKFDEVDALYDDAKKFLGKKVELLRDLSFLIDCSQFKLGYPKKEAIKTAHGYLMRYWGSQTWHNELIFNYLNCKVEIEHADDFQAEPFQKFLELLVEIKRRLRFEDDAIWFSDVLAIIMLDGTDSQATLELHERFVQRDFYHHPRSESLPQVLQEKIDWLRNKGCDLAIKRDFENPIYATTFYQAYTQLTAPN
jgi:hypothetical protein